LCTNRTDGIGNFRLNVVIVSRGLLCQAHRYVLFNTNKVQPYINEHMGIKRRLNPTKREKWIVDEHNKLFINWFRNRIEAQLTNRPNSISSNLR